MITTTHKRQQMSKQGSNMIYYHGTDATSALTIASHKIDVTKGKGELGKGFYVGNRCTGYLHGHIIKIPRVTM